MKLHGTNYYYNTRDIKEADLYDGEITINRYSIIGLDIAK